MPVDGLRLHLLGTTLVYLLLGLPLALLAEGVAGVAICITGEEPVALYACNFLLRGALPIAIAWCVLRITPNMQQRRSLLATYYLIAASVAGACASLAVTGLSALTSSFDSWQRISADEWIATLVLLTGAEAQLCFVGSVVLLVFGQQWPQELFRVHGPPR